MTTANELLAFERVSAGYAEGIVLDHCSFSMDEGETVALLGRNGVGKTTLLATIMGHTRVRGGEMRWCGRDLARIPRHRRAAAGLGWVPQEREIFASLTVEENLSMGLATKPGGTPIPAELFELFPVLKPMLHRRGGDLSGGQQQQLAIARALAAGPKLLVLDEPTEGIQPSIIKDIGRVIRTLADRGTLAIALVEQYYDFARELADSYAVMERGEVVARGRGKDMDADGVRGLVAI